MRLLIFPILLMFVAVDSSAQIDNPDDRKIVEGFIRCFKPLNKEKLADRVAFPLSRQYPIPPITNRQEMLTRFNDVFDAELIGIIAGSNPSKDWSAVGWRGIMLQNGELWIDADGRLTAVNYQGKFEKQKRNELIEAGREQLHPTLRNFQAPVLMASSSGFRIRIDQMQDKSYRYAAWKATASISTPPDLVLSQGEKTYEGSGGNHEYTFINGQYVYICSIEVLGEGDAPGELIVRKNGRDVLVQEFKTLDN